MKKQIRIAIPHGSAQVDKDCAPETIEALNRLAELAYKMPTEQLNKHGVLSSAATLDELGLKYYTKARDGVTPNEINMDGLPRRIQLEKMVPAEKAIFESGLLIEEMGADERLTNAQNKLKEARDLVADFVDSKIIEDHNKKA